MSTRIGLWTPRLARKSQALSLLNAVHDFKNKSSTSQPLQSTPKMSDLPPSPVSNSSEPTRIHILGLGNLGRLYAHALANLPCPPPITLLLHRSSLLQEWEDAGHQISITTNGILNSNGHFSVEDISAGAQAASSSSAKKPMISNLIVATKTLNVVSALELVKGRLNEESTLLFTQNGMGSLEEVDQHVFGATNIPSNKRPTYLTSVTSHGVYHLSPFSSVHAGLASVAIGQARQSPPPDHPENAQYLIDQIVQSPILNAVECPSKELLYLQLEKLVVNAIINPLTALLHCKNGDLFINNGPVLNLMRLLLQEASQVIQHLPEIRSSEYPVLEKRFSTRALEAKVLDVAAKTAQNTSSMLQDVRARRETEIEYINGWIVRKGRELGVCVERNEKVVGMMREGRRFEVDEVGDAFEGL